MSKQVRWLSTLPLAYDSTSLVDLPLHVNSPCYAAMLRYSIWGMEHLNCGTYVPVMLLRYHLTNQTIAMVSLIIITHYWFCYIWSSAYHNMLSWLSTVHFYCPLRFAHPVLNSDALQTWRKVRQVWQSAQLWRALYVLEVLRMAWIFGFQITWFYATSLARGAPCTLCCQHHRKLTHLEVCTSPPPRSNWLRHPRQNRQDTAGNGDKYSRTKNHSQTRLIRVLP